MCVAALIEPIHRHVRVVSFSAVLAGNTGAYNRQRPFLFSLPCPFSRSFPYRLLDTFNQLGS